ncbi:MAG TPA: glycosyltransferase family 4 protein [Saprospiraceae bacterium]|nr:glycosyltransferase family 4 protein [Saprospiraceae bacterium]
MVISKSLYKILVISDYRSVNSSRPEAEIFFRLAQLGHDITILSFPDANYYNDRFRAVGIRVIEKHPTKKYSRSFISYLRKLARENKYDILHAFNSQGLVNATWALQGLPTKLIGYRGYAGQTHWYDPMMYLKYFHPRVDNIIALSDIIKKVLVQNMLWGKNKVTRIHKGHDPNWYRDVQPADRKEFGFKENDILLCFLANVRPFKGLPYLMQATHEIPTEFPLHFLFIGNGYEEKNIQEMMGQSPYQKHFHMLGYRKDSQRILAMSDGLVLPSTHGESLTKSVIEAMSLGIVPIITDIEGNRGVVIDGESGWVVPAKDSTALAKAITEFVHNPGERKRRGENAQKHIAEHFHISQTVDEFLKLYERLIPTNHTRSET